MKQDFIMSLDNLLSNSLELKDEKPRILLTLVCSYFLYSILVKNE